MLKQYKFSVIIPIYNVEDYLREAIDSVIMQTIGFEANIQLILVNDGSTDGCGDICGEYKEKYPENIIYIEQENQGVSQARNAGIPYIKGKYVNFFDSDDIWGLDAFEKVWDFFLKHEKEIDVVCCKEVFFEARTGEHNLSNKFKKGNRIIDIHAEPKYILLSVKSSFIKVDAVHLERFDTRLSVGEDAKYLTHVILLQGRYGVMQNVIYNFRKRIANTSITQNPNIGRYTATIEYYYKHLLDFSIEQYGVIIPYIQHVVINGLKYRVLGTPVDFMSKNQWEEYTSRVISLIKRIDDTVIATGNNIQMSTKLYLLALKYGENVDSEVYLEGNALCFRGIKIGKVSKKSITIDEVKISWRKITISGIVKVPINENIGLYFKDGSRYCRVETKIEDQLTRKSFTGDLISRGRRFTITRKKSNEDMTLYLGKNGIFAEVSLNN